MAAPAALYARYSTEMQSESSIDDQHRECERLAERHGFEVVARFSDAAISGGTTQRPGYQAMLEAARSGEISVIVAEDASRLWRNLAEQAPRLAELADLGVHVITHDLDTRVETAGMLGAVLGASSEAYRREIGRRTRRGLEGRARKQLTTGGRAYGYVTEGGDRRIHAEQSAIVVEIFERYAAGDGLRTIAADLNARGVPSPGAAWRRTRNPTDGLWRVSSLHTLLRNELYVGRLVWNRARWVRSAADSRKRRYVENPRSAWIVHERPDLRIVDEEIWQRVETRCAENVELFGSQRARSSYLLSGLLRCAECGGAYVIVAHHPPRYGCSTNRHAGDVACANDLRVSSKLAERKIIEHARKHTLAPEAVELAIAEMHRLAKEELQVPVPELGRLEAQIAELKRLRDAGVLSDDVAGVALARAFRELEQARVDANKTTTAVFGAERIYRETIDELVDAIESGDVPVMREALRGMYPPIRLHSKGTYLVAEVVGERLLLVGGSATPVVAGARYFIELRD